MANARKRAYYDAVDAQVRARYGNTVTFDQLVAFAKETGINPLWIRRNEEFRVKRGVYRVPNPGEVLDCGVRRNSTGLRANDVVRDDSADTAEEIFNTAPAPVVAPALTPAPAPMQYTTDPLMQRKLESLKRDASLLSRVPKVDPAFVSFGDYDMILQTVQSRVFHPCFITGPTGNGKTYMVQQACAAAGREYIRVSITAETDEDDLIGGFRLRDGETVFEPGPVVVGMLRGAVVLLDEIDKACSKIMCLQSILEGESLTIKKLGITIDPEPGFTIFATANTKGRGSEDGKYVTSVLLDEAFLERFANTIEQEYPSADIERAILRKTYVKSGFKMTHHAEVFFDTLARWAENIRETYVQGGIEDLISTRRLIHIIKNYGMYGCDTDRAIYYACNRFDAKVKSAFADLFNKLAPSEVSESNVGSTEASGPDGF